MKATVAIVVLLIAALVSGAGWYLQSRKVNDKDSGLATQITSLSNQVTQVSSEAADAKQRNGELQQRLTATTSDLLSYSNRLTVAQAGLVEARDAAAKAAREAEQELQKREARIADLEVANKNLDQQAKAASEAIHDLETRIGETERQLAAAHGDRDLLMRELQRLQTEKAELERRFSDLVVLRAQMQQLQQDLAADAERDALRAQLNRKRHLKGAELLMRGFDSAVEEESNTVDMEVEIHRDGSSRIDSGENPQP
ncbi:MAG: hypothetical protein KDM81_00250 [Verrucomicrobiae bacterium]|nr:hypothetical protein [Verrucomicrobiae bacterium]MCP5522073.1 hypothetical protein [Verrucomicrobiales bacterium]